MDVLTLLAGVAIGFLTACYGMYRLIVGTLKFTHDDLDGDTYMYVELDRPGIDRIVNKKYVVMRVYHSQK